MKRIFYFILLIMSASIYARTDCPEAKVLHIQLEGKKILYYQEGGPWRTLGYLGNKDGTEERYSAMLAAQLSSKRVKIWYRSDNYNCSQTYYGEAAYLLRTYN